jgi:Spy/CpxP family protein refolding chaperone
MRKSVFALLFGLLISLPSFAQDRADRPDRRADVSPEKKATMMIRKMAEELDLNDQQIIDLQPIFLKFHQEESDDKEDRKARRDELQEELAKVLSKEQMEKLQAKMEERKNKRGKGRKPMHKEG